MSSLHRFTCLIGLFLLATTAWSQAAPKEAEYKAADSNFYFRASVLKADPTAVLLPEDALQHKGDSYILKPKVRAPKEIYLQVVKDWIEPITPPSMPTSLGIAPDAMQIREPQGEVQVALPSNPTSFTPATDQMTIPNGSVVKTGADGTAAVLFGGVNSARFTPRSEGTVQQTITPALRATEVDLKSGAVFSKVGLRRGEKQDYQVHTPFGVAAARGTDFVTVALLDRTDVWIAQGTVDFKQPNGQLVGTVKSEGKGPLQIIRFPAITDAHQAMMASAETMTAAMNFIPMVDVKVKALRDKLSSGTKLTAQETKYLHLIKRVPCLIKLALVEPPAPPPAPVTPSDSSKPLPPSMPPPQRENMTPRPPATDTPATNSDAATKSDVATPSPQKDESSTPAETNAAPDTSSKPAETPAKESSSEPATNPPPVAPVAHGPNDTVP